MKSLKKTLINIEAGFDFLRSRFARDESVYVASAGVPIIITMLGAMFGVLASTINDLQDQFVDKNAKYEATDMVVDFPSNCDIDNGFYFAQQGPNGAYTLYKGSNGVYEPQTRGESEDFAEAFNECLDAAEKMPKLREGFVIVTGHDVSQPMRSIDVNDDDSASNYRRLGDAPATKYNFTEWVDKNGSEQAAFAALRSSWAPALKGFEDEKIYDHAAAKNVTTFEYKDSYQPYNVNWIKGAGVLGAVVGLSILFSGSPNAQARARKEDRAKRRRALDAKPLDF